MKPSIKQGLHNHLQKKSLSTQQLKQLQRLQDSHGQNKTVNRATRLIIISVAVALMLSVLVLYNATVQSVKQNMPLLIAEEVVSNHLKLKPLEVRSNQFQIVSDYFTLLNFAPMMTQRLPGFSKILLGGRYCSLQGVTAAQLRLQDGVNRPVQTLYETGYDAKVFKNIPNLDMGEQPVRVYAKGVAVDIWVEKGVLFALTH